MLPEQFRGAPGQGAVGGTTWPAEPLSGPTIAIVAALARKYRMYVVAPIRELLVSTTQPPSSQPPSASAAGTGAGAGKGKQDTATATTGADTADSGAAHVCPGVASPSCISTV